MKNNNYLAIYERKRGELNNAQRLAFLKRIVERDKAYIHEFKEVERACSIERENHKQEQLLIDDICTGDKHKEVTIRRMEKQYDCKIFL